MRFCYVDSMIFGLPKCFIQQVQRNKLPLFLLTSISSFVRFHQITPKISLVLPYHQFIIFFITLNNFLTNFRIIIWSFFREGMSAKKVRSSSTRSEVNQQQLFQSILVKFLINLPKEELDDSIRRAYHYQKAYYYFIDFICKDLSLSPQLRKLTNKDFFDKLNQYAGSTLPKKSKGEDIMILLKQNRPTCGAIILNERGDKVLITSSCGKLGFPKGGKNENQSASKCAARQVKQQVGLFIHDKISEQNKIQFMYRGVKVTYFIVQNFDENEKLKIDENEIDQAYWMRISEVSKNIHLLTEKNRLAWKEFQMISIIQPKLTMQDFLNTYREKNSRKEKNKEEEIFNENPLLNFKFNREKLFAVFTV